MNDDTIGWLFIAFLVGIVVGLLDARCILRQYSREIKRDLRRLDSKPDAPQTNPFDGGPWSPC